MKEIIQADYPIVREEIPTDEAVLIFRKRGLKDKADLMETRDRLLVLGSLVLMIH